MKTKTTEQMFAAMAERQGCAYHEAGHAVFAIRHGMPLASVTVKKRGEL